MKASSRKDFAYAMTMLKALSWPVGTWPLQNYNVFSTMRTGFAILFLLIMLIIVLSEMYLDRNNAEKNLDVLVILICGILAVSKVMSFRIWPAGLISNFSSAVNDYNELSDEKKRTVVRHHAYMGRVATISMICFSYFSSTLFVSVPMLAGENKKVINVTEEDSSKKYPFPSECTLAPINIPENLHFIVFVIEYLMLLLTSTGNLGSDSLFFGITFHLCGQVEILGLEFDNLNENERAAEHYNVLTKRHINLLNLAEMLNETVSYVLIIQLFSSCLLICTSGFQFIIALGVGDIVLMVKTFIVMSTLLAQMFAYSYVGEYLKRQMEGVGYSAYSCKWYNLHGNLTRNIVYTIMKSQDPVYLMGGKFFIINMETYMNIVKTSMSYLSVLRVMISV